MSAGADPYGRDLRLVFAPAVEGADLAVGAADLETVSGIANLCQALTLRLLVDRGELTALGHPRYGTRARELLGQTLDRANLELLRRYVRQSIQEDPRVAEVLGVAVSARPQAPGVVDIVAQVRGLDGAQTQVEATLDAR
ncbi:hypothetical protein [uncultured Thiodictyon sp.]|uniref:hypothetical protein n=1 Tax=uncultured Thiodictyon sp. TaxID=1846217 RepID=UPI0025F51B57|nr:hypothetical protein [uncultured Thiodictyon sp.]